MSLTTINSGVFTGSPLSASTIATSQQSLFGEPDYRISVHKARNGLVVVVKFASMASQYEPPTEMWIVNEDQKVQDVIAAAIAAHGLGTR